MAPWPAIGFAPSTAAWRIAAAAPKALRIGDYLVGEEGDLLLYGHPDIRY